MNMKSNKFLYFCTGLLKMHNLHKFYKKSWLIEQLSYISQKTFELAETFKVYF